MSCSFDAHFDSQNAAIQVYHQIFLCTMLFQIWFNELLELQSIYLYFQWKKKAKRPVFGMHGCFCKHVLKLISLPIKTILTNWVCPFLLDWLLWPEEKKLWVLIFLLFVKVEAYLRLHWVNGIVTNFLIFITIF